MQIYPSFSCAPGCDIFSRADEHRLKYIVLDHSSGKYVYFSIFIRKEEKKKFSFTWDENGQ